jgi:hypothetical protein
MPKISCGAFTIASDRAAVISSYSDNAAHPNITGELRFWDLLTGEYSDSQSFVSSVSSHVSTSADIAGFFDAVSHEWLMRFIEDRIETRRRRPYRSSTPSSLRRCIMFPNDVP